MRNTSSPIRIPKHGTLKSRSPCQSIESNNVTSSSQKKSCRIFNLPQVIENNGEPSRARTCDPLIKSQLLYQLSYRPTTEVELYVPVLRSQPQTLHHAASRNPK